MTGILSRIVPAVALTLGAVGCGSTDHDERIVTPTVVTRQVTNVVAPRAADRDCATAALPMRSETRAYAAVARVSLVARSRPAGRAIARFGVLNANGVATVFGVLARRGCADRGWYRVQLPVRPNGAVGWVRTTDVQLQAVGMRIVVDLSRRRFWLSRAGRIVLTAPVSIGAPATPTPVGSFYVNQRLVAPDPSGPYGPGAIGISAFSPVLVDWIQGGPVAIHGTNRPDLIGHAVSHGCVRVRNDVLRRLYELAEPGTPVSIRS